MRKFFICKEENGTPGVRLRCVVLALAAALIVLVLHPLCQKHNVVRENQGCVYYYHFVL